MKSFKIQVLAFLCSLCIAVSAIGQTVFPAIRVNGTSDLRGHIKNGPDGDPINFDGGLQAPFFSGNEVITPALDADTSLTIQAGSTMSIRSNTGMTIHSVNGAITLQTNSADRLTIANNGSLATLGKLTTLAVSTGTAGLNLPHGTAPTSPVNGDVWTTTAGMFARINGSTVGPFSSFSSGSGTALTKTDDTNVTLTLGGSPSTALVNAASLTLGWSGTLAASRGGLGMSTVTDDTIAIANGSTWESKAIPNCTDTGGNHLNYTASSNSLSCGTSGGGGGGSPGGSDTQVQFNNMGAFGGSASLTWDGATLTTDGLHVTGNTTNDGNLDVTGQISAFDDTTLFKTAVFAENNDPRFGIFEDDASTNQHAWIMGAASNVFNIWACNDAGSCTSAIGITRSAGTPVALSFNGVDLTPTSGTFTFTWDLGCTTSPTQSVTWVRVGKMVTISSTGGSFTCTSDAVAFQDTSNPMPSQIRPSGSRIIYGNPVEVNGALVQNSCITVFSAGTIAFRPVNTAGDLNCLGSFGSSGTAGMPDWTITYGL